MARFVKNRLVHVLSSCLLLICCATSAVAQDAAVIGPLTGTSSIIGEFMLAGANAFDEKLDVLDDKCTSVSGQAAATTAFDRGAQILIGMPCVEALDAAALVALGRQSAPIILALGVEVPDVTSREKRANWPVFRFAPDAEQEATTIANHIKREWRNVDFALLDDGTLYGRQLVETVRFLLELDNLKPVFVDNYRPLLENQSGILRRLQRSGATHVFIGGDAFDASVMGQGAISLSIPLTIAGGSAFRAPPTDGTLPDGTVFAAPLQEVARVKSQSLSGYAATTYAALEIAQQAQQYAIERQLGLDLAMRVLRFDTVLGPVSFGNDGENTRQWYGLYIVENGMAKLLSESSTQ